MKIIKKDLDAAVSKSIITEAQSNQLWHYLSEAKSANLGFNGISVVYYIGGITILSAMSWFLTNAWDNGVSLMIVSVAFAFIYLIIGNRLWKGEGLKTPGGLLVTAAVGLVPVFTYGLQKELGFWPQNNAPNNYHDYHHYIKGSWLLMEVATITASLIALRFYSFTFLTFPLALSLWYLSMDITPIIFGIDNLSFTEMKIISVFFGLVMLAVAYFADKKFKDTDYSFWLYLYGMVAFWGGLTSMNSDSELGKFIYFLVNICLMIASLYLRRKTIMVFGVLGIFAYISHLAWVVFKDSALFPVFMVIAGISVIYLGVKYQKSKARVEEAALKLLPTFLLKYRPEERA